MYDFAEKSFKKLYAEGLYLPYSSLVFLFLFFPTTMFLYAYAGDVQKKNKILMIASLVFYFWSAPKYVPLLFVMSFAAWISANFIIKLKNPVRFLAVTVSVFIQISVLFYFKFLNSTIGFDSYIGKYFIPIGITFYVLRLVTYLIDVYRMDAKICKRYTDVLLFASIFHLSIMAPLVSYKEMAASLKKRNAVVPEIGQGINRFVIGIFKASVLALSCDRIVHTMFPENLETFLKVPALGLWFGAIAFMLQMYLVCSAYSDMAIGMGKMLGFKYNENFNYPYMSTSIYEFCSKWYMTLSDFIKEYIYMPIRGRKSNSIRKIGAYIVSVLFLILFIGKNWNGIGLILYFLMTLWLERFFADKKFVNPSKRVRHLYTLMIVCLGWIIFRFKDSRFLIAMLKGMIGLNGNGFIRGGSVQTSVKYLINICIAGIGCTSLFKQTYQWIRQNTKKYKVLIHVRRIIEVAGPIVLLIFSSIVLFDGDYTMFLYF